VPHEVAKKCPFCGKSNVAIVTAALELEGGGVDETDTISLGDPQALARVYSLAGLEVLYTATVITQWHCTVTSAPVKNGCGGYYGVATIKETLNPKLRLAAQMCGKSHGT